MQTNAIMNYAWILDIDGEIVELMIDNVNHLDLTDAKITKW